MDKVRCGKAMKGMPVEWVYGWTPDQKDFIKQYQARTKRKIFDSKLKCKCLSRCFFLADDMRSTLHYLQENGETLRRANEKPWTMQCIEKKLEGTDESQRVLMKAYLQRWMETAAAKAERASGIGGKKRKHAL